MTVLVCTTCPRYSSDTGDFVKEFEAASKRSEATGEQVPVRRVRCLGGCPEAGVVAVDAPHKARVRFTGLAAAPDDVVAELWRFAHDHAESPTGDPDTVGLPELLADHLSSVTRKRTCQLDRQAPDRSAYTLPSLAASVASE